MPGNNGEPEVVRSGPITCRLSTVEPASVQWLWRDKIPRGKLTLWYGDPGDGKTLAALDIAARISTGTPWPDGSPNQAGGVLLLSAEDDLQDTIVPRLLAARADLERIVACTGVESVYADDERREAPFDLTTDVRHLEAIAAAVPDLALCILDPVSAFMGDTDSHKNAEVRAVLSRLADLAARYRFAILMITHMTKGIGGSARYRAMGSLAYIAASRAAWLFCRDKQDQDRRLMVMSKNNLAADVGGLAYRIRTTDESPDVPQVWWSPEPVTMTADQAISEETGQERSELQEAIDWLSDALADGPQPAAEIKKESALVGIAYATLRRAKAALKVKIDPGGKGGPRWLWYTDMSNLSNLSNLPENRVSEAPDGFFDQGAQGAQVAQGGMYGDPEGGNGDGEASPYWDR